MVKLHTFASDEGTAAEVYINQQTGAFHVRLVDLDAGQALPTVTIFKGEDAAVDFAKSLI